MYRFYEAPKGIRLFWGVSLKAKNVSRAFSAVHWRPYDAIAVTALPDPLRAAHMLPRFLLDAGVCRPEEASSLPALPAGLGLS